MDIADVRNRLQALGVSLDGGKDDPPDPTGELIVQRQYRAALYLDRLEATRTFLTTTLAGAAAPGIGPVDYPFVAAALARGELLNELALSLDEWLCPAVERAINEAVALGGIPLPSYQGWFDTHVLTTAAADPQNQIYAQNVAAFFGPYPITAAALNQIQANFQTNIATAVGRVVADKAAITALFSDLYYGLTLSALTELSSTGSDFHKGGQQVLILTFTTRSFLGYAPRTGTLNVVYKPTDLEADCLLIGNAAAVNRATASNFMAASLVEQFNAHVAANPAPGLERLPTYRILPRNRTSTAAGPNVAVRNAYGYLEFLPHAAGASWEVFGYYLYGTGDFLIHRGQSEAPVIERFYHQMGQILALACTFSLTDLHVENVRATAYQPHPIDLEISLTSRVNDVSETLLLDAGAGGINVASRANEKFAWRFTALGNGRVRMDKAYVTKFYDNRLYAMRPGKRLVRVNAFWLLEGLDNGLAVLGAMANSLGPWRARLANVLVRILPLETGKWNMARSNIFVRTVREAPLNTALAPTVVRYQTQAATSAYEQANPPPPPDPPEQAAIAAGQATADLTAFDVPVYYHRIGTVELLDSTGTVLPVPPTVTLYDNNVPPNAVPVATGLGRAAYFGATPTTANVDPQLAALAGGGNVGRMNVLQPQVLRSLNLNAVPTGPGVLI